jgi:hypothetical protein
MNKELTKENLFKSLFDFYDIFKESNLKSDFIRYDEIKSLIASIENNSIFQVEKLGESIEKRGIYSITFGTGKIKVLAWSQMHGDEPTATAAIFDLIKFFRSDDSLNVFRKFLLEKITFHFIPMLNPDGAEKYQRENIYNIDLNRDALSRQSFESQILWKYADKINPDYGFNLHDQNSYYTAGISKNPSAISLLAPPMNHVKSIDYVRERSMQVICEIYDRLSIIIPGNIARYKDDFEPRAFGDNFVKNGISTILIESGFYQNDPQKDFVRKLNFIALLSAFNIIAQNDFSSIEYRKYFDIPENQELLLDLLLRNISLSYNGHVFKLDLGVKREKLFDSQNRKFYFQSKIAEIGDLSTFYGIEEHDMTGYSLIAPKILSVDDTADFNLIKDGEQELKILNGFFIDQ